MTSRVLLIAGSNATVIRPGGVRTKRTDWTWLFVGKTEADVDGLLAHISGRCASSPGWQCGARGVCSYFASNGVSFMTGAVLPVVHGGTVIVDVSGAVISDIDVDNAPADWAVQRKYDLRD